MDGNDHWGKPVGVSLLAMAVYQPAMMLNVPPPSRASSAPTGYLSLEFRGRTQPPVGVSLLAMAVHQPAMMPNVPPPSRASSAPTGYLLLGFQGLAQIPCGSEPARDGGLSASNDAECTAAIASKLSSHRLSVTGIPEAGTNPL